MKIITIRVERIVCSVLKVLKPSLFLIAFTVPVVKNQAYENKLPYTGSRAFFSTGYRQRGIGSF